MNSPGQNYERNYESQAIWHIFSIFDLDLWLLGHIGDQKHYL